MWAVGLVFVSCGEKGKEKAVPSNHPPEIKSARIIPLTPSVQDELSITFNTYDRDGDSVDVEITWILNEVPLDLHDERVKIPGLKKGDSVSAVLVPFDGKVRGEEFKIPPVRVINSPPRIVDMSLSPFNPTTEDDLSVSVRVEDPDGDPVSIKYRWFINRLPVEGVEGDTLPHTYTKKGDVVAVTAEPTDGESYGTEYVSYPVEIMNSPPRIISSPPTSLTPEGHFVYKIRAVDPDNDPLTFELLTPYPGLSLTQDGTLIFENVPSGEEIHIKIAVKDDSNGVSYQEFTFTFQR